MTNHVSATSLITITDGYIKASIPGSHVTAAYMTINNNRDKKIIIQKVTSTFSDRIEIHEHSMSEGMMHMREVGKMVISANSHIELQPSGLHLMIFNIKKKISKGDVIPLRLHLSDQSIIQIQLPVYRYNFR